MTDAELIELFTYIAHLRDEIKKLEFQNLYLRRILQEQKNA